MPEMVEKSQPYVTTIDGKRRFATSPVAVLAIIVNEREEILLHLHPEQNQGWQVVNGAMEAGESILEAVLRETAEEVGPDLRVRPLGTVHVATFHFDPQVRYMLSVSYLLAYEGGPVKPGDDMEGCQYRWWRLDELANEEISVIIPPEGKWLLARAVDLYRLWVVDDMTGQPGFEWTVKGKNK